MRTIGSLLIFMTVGLATCLTEPIRADFPPKPRPLPFLEDECARFASPAFERLLSELKAERDALDEEWKSRSKQRSASNPASDQDHRVLAELLKKSLDRLRSQEKKKPALILLPEVDLTPKKPEPPDPKTKGDAGEPKNSAVRDAGLPNGIDPLHLGNVLFRMEKFEDALESFRSIDLKAKKSEERAPIQFLMASCLLHLGKNEAAVELLREVANARGDERTAGYAQWQLEMNRWQREINDHLQNLRRRRLAAEKRP